MNANPRCTFITSSLVLGPGFPRGISGPVLGASSPREAAVIIEAGGIAVLPADDFDGAAEVLRLFGCSQEQAAAQVAMSRGEVDLPDDWEELFPSHTPDLAAYPPCTILIDDVRSFRDGRDCRVARSSGEGLKLLRILRVQRLEHLWLDHDLGGEDDIWPVIRVLEDASLSGVPFDIGLIHVHASRSGPAHRMGVALRRAGYTVERSFDLRLFTW